MSGVTLHSTPDGEPERATADTLEAARIGRNPDAAEIFKKRQAALPPKDRAADKSNALAAEKRRSLLDGRLSSFTVAPDLEDVSK